MLRIAVCDDEPEQLEKVAGLLRDYGQRRSVPPWQVFPFPSGYALLDGAEEQGGFDLYLLDVLMPGLDGIQTGAKLRAQGDPGEIVYLTNSRDHAVESYGVRAFYYLVKPVEAEALFPVLDAALERLERRDRESVVVHTAQGPPAAAAGPHPLCGAGGPGDALPLRRRHGGHQDHPDALPGGGEVPAPGPALYPVRGQLPAEPGARGRGGEPIRPAGQRGAGGPAPGGGGPPSKSPGGSIG